MSEKISSAANQQGSRRRGDPSETTRRAPLSKKEIRAYLLGALHDGTFSKNKRFRISQKGSEWLKVLKKFFSRLGYNSWIYKEGESRKVYVLETLANFLDFKFNPLRLNERNEKKAYVRGFFDAEGGIPRNEKARFYIQLTQNDRVKIEKLKTILDELGIKTGKIHNPSKRANPDYWRIYILANWQKKFITKINSWHPRKIRTLSQRFKSLDSYGIKNLEKEDEDIVHAL